ncbi:unnamed protein product [Mytilus coruscus]|uniref:Uncharacterized protein n=1 Tax=Mytilus coruscus TaxID=42192 RepID=A0A6J8F0B4_MYTCO|nr:unnamed protein product [Mytilus coruscus]
MYLQREVRKPRWRLKSIETSVESVKDIRKDLLLISCQVIELETSVANIVKSQKQLETSCQALSDLFDDVKEKSNKRDEVLNQHAAQLIKHSDEAKTVNNDFDKMSRRIKNLEKQLENTKPNTQQHDTSRVQTLQNTVLDLQCRSMKNNIQNFGRTTYGRCRAKTSRKPNIRGKHAVLVRDKLFIDGKQYILDESMEHIDMRSGNSRSDNPNSYRDSLLTSPKDMDRPYKRMRLSDSTPPMKDNGD